MKLQPERVRTFHEFQHCGCRFLGIEISGYAPAVRLPGYRHHGLCFLQGADPGAEHQGCKSAQGIAGLLCGTVCIVHSPSQWHQFHSQRHGGYGRSGGHHPVPAGASAHSGAGGQPPLHGVFDPYGDRQRRGKDHRADGPCLHGDVPEPHRRPDRIRAGDAAG